MPGNIDLTSQRRCAWPQPFGQLHSSTVARECLGAHRAIPLQSTTCSDHGHTSRLPSHSGQEEGDKVLPPISLLHPRYLLPFLTASVPPSLPQKPLRFPPSLPCLPQKGHCPLLHSISFQAALRPIRKALGVHSTCKTTCSLPEEQRAV